MGNFICTRETFFTSYCSLPCDPGIMWGQSVDILFWIEENVSKFCFLDIHLAVKDYSLLKSKQHQVTLLFVTYCICTLFLCFNNFNAGLALPIPLSLLMLLGLSLIWIASLTLRVYQ